MVERFQIAVNSSVNTNFAFDLGEEASLENFQLWWYFPDRSVFSKENHCPFQIVESFSKNQRAKEKQFRHLLTYNFEQFEFSIFLLKCMITF